MVLETIENLDGRVEVSSKCALADAKLPWDKPEFASVQPISATHGNPGGGADGAGNHS